MTCLSNLECENSVPAVRWSGTGFDFHAPPPSVQTFTSRPLLRIATQKMLPSPRAGEGQGVRGRFHSWTPPPGTRFRDALFGLPAGFGALRVVAEHPTLDIGQTQSDD
jgi:hypothetical protein